MIICLGTTPAVQKSMTFGHLVIDSVNRTADVHQYASGKSINVTRVLHTLGNKTMALGFAGGNSGEFLRKDLDRAGILHDFVTVEPETRMCTTVVNQADGTATELIEESRQLPDDGYEKLISNFHRHLYDATGVVLSGSLPPNAPANFYARCTTAAIAAGKFVLVDGTGEPLRQALPFRPTVIKPNRQELSQTVHSSVESDDDLKSAIRQLLAMGSRWAVVTNGSKDTVASDGRQFWKIATPKVQVISAIGSGDSFAAGLASGIAAGQTIPQACQLAAACGSANAMTPFAGHLKKSDVDQLLDRATLSTF